MEISLLWIGLGLAALGYKIELKGTRYYQYHHFYEWLSTKENFKQKA
jgi:hypothetical protein